MVATGGTGGESAREVVIRLLAEVHDETPKAFQSVAEMALDANRRIKEAFGNSAAEVAQAIKTATRAQTEAHQAAIKAATAAAKNGAAAQAKAAQDAAKRQGEAFRAIADAQADAAKSGAQAVAKSAKESHQTRDKSGKDQTRRDAQQVHEQMRVTKARETAEKKAAREIDRAKDQAIKAQARRDVQQFAAQSRIIKAREAAEKKALREVEREQQRTAKEETRRDAKQLAAQMKAIKARETAEKKAAREIASAHRQAQSAHEQTTAKLESMNERTAEGFKQSLSGAMSLGRGVAMLGLLGEKDLEKVLRGLIKVQAAFDVMRGGIEMIQGMTRGWKAYTVAVETAAAAHGTLAAMQTATTVGAAKKAGGGVVGGIGAAAVSGAAGGAVGAKVVTGGAGKAAVAGAGGTAMTVSAGIAAFLGALASVTMSLQMWRDMFKFGFMGGATPGSLMDTIGTAEATVADWVGRMFGGDLMGKTALERTRKRLAIEPAERQRQEQRAAIDIREQRALREARTFGRDQLREIEIDPQRRLETTRTAAEQARQEAQTARNEAVSLQTLKQLVEEGRARAGAMPLAANIEEADRRHLEAIDKANAARQRELTAVRAVAAEQIRGAKEQIDALRAQHQQHVENAKAIRESLQTAKERFGALDPVRRARLIAIKRKADEGRKLFREEETELAMFADLEPIGKIVREGRMKRAEEGGFAEFIGREVEARAKAMDEAAATLAKKTIAITEATRTTLQKLSRDIQMEIEVKDSVVVELKTDDEALVATVIEQTERLLDERQETVERMIETAFDDERRRLNAKDQGALVQQGAGV